jgi:hypothetical protein
MISSVRNFSVRILDADRFTIAIFQILDIKSNYLPGIVQATQTSGTYRLLFNENNHAAVDMILTDIDEKLEAIGNWDYASVHYRYITMDDVEVSGKNSQAQGKSFWQEHYKFMSGTIPEVVDTNMFDRPHQRRPQTVHMSYSDIARRSGSPLTQS